MFQHNGNSMNLTTRSSQL